MGYRTTLRGEQFRFADLRELLAKANEPKSGDALAGIAAGSMRERAAAKLALADVPLRELVDTELVDDDVSARLAAHHDAAAFEPIASLTVGELRERLLDRSAPPLSARAITPEIAAAVAKVMGNQDLIVAASRLRTVTRCRNTMGGPGVFGVRIQPNHPADDPAGIAVGVLDGLLYGCGDAVIGINPVTDAVGSVHRLLQTVADLIDALALPTQSCVLAHASTQLAALEAGAPVDLLFASVAGSTAANESFGITPALLAEGREQVLASHRTRPGFVGEQVTYFETGQGSALSADAHHGVDQLTMEARAQGVARLFDPFLVNSVVGFIGPEYLAGGRQIVRAGIEDHFVGKLLGLPMGVDVCYTNHVDDTGQDDNDNLLVLLAAAGCNYVMGVPGADDVMLGYQSTSFHDVASVRDLFGLHPAPEFEAWLAERGRWADGRLLPPSVRDAEALEWASRKVLEA
ncbi:MAG: ethanolamine ammonia-lyase subunit EutB [Acidimicrobiia bacterium]